MAQFIEFLGNHWLLSSLWLLTLGAIFFYHQRTGSSSLRPQQAIMMINRQDAVVLDVREKKEFDKGHIVDAINIPLVKLKQRVTELKKYRETPVIVTCKLGQQSGDAAKTLQEAGHTDVYRLAGGITEWKSQTLPLVQNTREEKTRTEKGKAQKTRARKSKGQKTKDQKTNVQTNAPKDS